MYGKNQVADARPDGRANGYRIVGAWYTIQGEGPLAGLPAVFVRFAGCNLRCAFCDTEFERDAEEVTLKHLVRTIVSLCVSNHCRLIVLTGGEPMLQDLTALVRALPDDIWIQIETAGTVWPAGLEATLNMGRVTIVCSPKTPTVHKMIQRHASAWKYIIRDGEVDSDGLPWTPLQGDVLMSTRRRVFRAGVSPESVYVQPCDDGDSFRSSLHLREACRSAMQHGYRLSLQLHKIAGLD